MTLGRPVDPGTGFGSAQTFASAWTITSATGSGASLGSRKTFPVPLVIGLPIGRLLGTRYAGPVHFPHPYPRSGETRGSLCLVGWHTGPAVPTIPETSHRDKCFNTTR